MITMVVLVAFLWIVAGAFAISDLLVMMALLHFRDDREIRIICFAALVVFAAVCCGVAGAAMNVGRRVAW